MEAHGYSLSIVFPDKGHHPVKNALVIGIRSVSADYKTRNIYYDLQNNSSNKDSSIIDLLFGYCEDDIDEENTQKSIEDRCPKFIVETAYIGEDGAKRTKDISINKIHECIQFLYGIRKLKADEVKEIVDERSYLGLVMPDNYVFPVFHSGVIIFDKKKEVLLFGKVTNKEVCSRLMFSLCRMVGVNPDEETMGIVQKDINTAMTGYKLLYIADMAESGNVLFHCADKCILQKFCDSFGFFVDELPDKAFTFYNYFIVEPGTLHIVPVRKERTSYNWDMEVDLDHIMKEYGDGLKLCDDDGIGIDGVMSIVNSDLPKL